MGGGSRPSSSAKTLRDVGLSNVACWTSSRKRGNYQVRVWVDGGSKLIMYYEHDNWDGPLAGSLTCFKTEAKALRVYEHLRVDGDEQKIITFTKDPKQLDDYKVVMLDGLSGKIECVICKTAVNKASPEARDYLPGTCYICRSSCLPACLPACLTLSSLSFFLSLSLAITRILTIPPPLFPLPILPPKTSMGACFSVLTVKKKRTSKRSVVSLKSLLSYTRRVIQRTPSPMGEMLRMIIKLPSWWTIKAMRLTNSTKEFPTHRDGAYTHVSGMYAVQ